MTSSRRRPPAWAIFGGLALLFGPGAAPPAVQTLRVPSERVKDWFPADAEWKGLSATEFEGLLRAARVGGTEASGPRLLQASHSARWDDGVLSGRTEWLIEPPKAAPGRLILEPWTPAVVPGAKGAASVRSDDTGQTFVRVEPAARPVDPFKATTEWTLRARAGSHGRRFTLGLPGAGACLLRLDLPEGVEPEGPPGVRRGPTPNGDEGRADWTFAGAAGSFDLRLVPRGDTTGPPEPPRLWVEGATRVEVGESVALWTLQWTVASGPHPPKELVLAVDPGLESIEAQGTEVDDVQTEPDGGGSTRVSVRFRNPGRAAGGASAVTSVVVKARTPVPSEGGWVVPSARPVNAVWTGGQTAVRLDPSRVLAGVRTLAGRRVEAGSAEPAGERRLVFEASKAAPVAELLFRKPAADVSADVRGQLLVGNTSPRMSCRLTWRVYRGRPHRLGVDLPRSWVADRVEIEGVDEPASWHPEVRPEGGTRLHVTSPSGDWSERSLVLNLWATSTVAGGRGPLSLPRVRPVGARVADEVWVARTQSGLTVQPAAARGLAWVDPSEVAAVPPAPAAVAGGDVGEARPALAWRWTDDDGEARVERGRSDAIPRGSVGQVAVVTADRLSVAARVVAFSRDEPVRTLAVGLSEAVEAPEGWRVTDAATGQDLSITPLDARARVVAGVPGRGPAWSVELPQFRRGRVAVVVRGAGRWGGRGRVPLVLLPAALRAQGALLILAGRDVRESAEVEGVRTLDPETTAGSIAADAGPDDAAAGPSEPEGFRRARAYAYDSAAARVVLQTQALRPGGGGVIREAVLTTVSAPQGGPGLRRLSLKVVPERTPTLEVTLPPGSTAERVRRDGQPVAPVQAGGALSIPLAGSAFSRLVTVVTVDYRVAETAASGRARLSPERPRFSLPCLALTWEVVVPEPWAVASWGAALTPTNPATKPPGVFDRLGGGRARAVWGARPARPVAGGSAAEVLRDLDRRVAATGAGEATLGEWLTRWDAGPSPIVVDRAAVGGSGSGPRSRAVPPRAGAERPRSAAAALRPLGLAAVPVGRFVLVTTRSAAADVGKDDRHRPRAGWGEALGEAAAWGSDASGRFLSVARWREEITPRTAATPEAVEGEAGTGRAVWRFSSPGWPESGAEVLLVDRRAQAAGGWAAALAVLTVGLAARGLSRPVRAAGTAALVGFGLLATALAPPAFGGLAAGLARGSVGLTFFWLGRSLPGRSALRWRVRWPGARRRRPAVRSGPTTPAVVLLAAAAAATPWALARPPAGADEPILALLPYEGLPDPNRPPDRALLQLKDYERLRAAAAAAAVAPPLRLGATEARHRIGWRDGVDLVAVSDLTIAAEGRGVGLWTFPVDDSREITAQVDGEDAPVRVEPGGRTATVRIDAGGDGRGGDRTFRLRLRRRVTPKRRGGGASVGLAVNAVAASSIEVEGHPSGLRTEVPCARGPVRTGGPGNLTEARLGPVDRLQVRWVPAEGSGAASGTVEGLYLWDVTPAGDLVRTRLTYRNAGGTEVVRVALGPGALVREASLAGTVDASYEGTAGRPEWVARVTPPLPDGAVVSLVVWRPLAEPGSPNRTPPRVEPLGVERFSGTLALRRPSDWGGRLVPAGGGVPVGEDVFSRSWGVLPEEPLTLAGAVRLPPALAPASLPGVETGPIPARVRVTTAARLNLQAGRIDATFDAELTQTTGAVHEVELGLPEGFRVVRVAADGLTDGDLPAAGPMTLRFDGPPLRQRRVRVQGWLATAGDPLASTPSAHEVEAPWPRWPGQDESPGTLTVTATTRFQVRTAAGVEAAPVEPQPPAASAGPFRATYRVSRPEAPGRLRWGGEPPRVAVSVRSQMTVDPDTAGWVAVVRYDVSGGPLDAINLRLPSAWARPASVVLEGLSHQQVTETRGETTYWSIRPERPVWGTQRMVVRSAVPFPPGGERAFPDLSPLGRSGAVDTHLRVVNQTRQPLATEGSSGLQPVTPQVPPAGDELATSSLSTAPVTGYHVVKESWSLRIQKAGDRAHPGAAAGVPKIERAEIDGTLAADGTVLGVGRYEVSPRSAAFVDVSLPEGLTPLFASVNGAPARPLNSGPGLWEIPLPEASVCHVALVWRSAPSPAPAGGERPIPLPVLGRERVPGVVTVYAPRGVKVESPPGRLVRSGPEWVSVERAGWQARRVGGSLPTLDRSARRDGENLVSALVRVELHLRQAERAAAWDPVAQTAPNEARIARVREASAAVRARLGEDLRNEALEEFEESARVHLGLSTAPAPVPPAPDLLPPAITWPLGRPHAFLGELSGEGRTPWLVWSEAPRPDAGERPWVVGLGLGSVAVVPLAWLVARRPRLSRAVARVALVAGSASVAVGAGLVWFLAVAGLAALGRLSRA